MFSKGCGMGGTAARASHDHLRRAALQSGSELGYQLRQGPLLPSNGLRRFADL
jgi:hypothetical protein